jgi:hypothetical protein
MRRHCGTSPKSRCHHGHAAAVLAHRRGLDVGMHTRSPFPCATTHARTCPGNHACACLERSRSSLWFPFVLDLAGTPFRHGTPPYRHGRAKASPFYGQTSCELKPALPTFLSSPGTCFHRTIVFSRELCLPDRHPHAHQFGPSPGRFVRTRAAPFVRRRSCHPCRDRATIWSL